MNAKLLESLGSKVIDQWVGTLLTPAFIFWLGGFIAISQRIGWSTLVKHLSNYPQPLQIAILVAGFIIVVISGFIVQRFDLITLRFLEGYWPPCLNPYRHYKIQYYRKQKQKLDNQIQTLREREDQNKTRLNELKERIDNQNQGASTLTDTEKQEYLQLNEQLLSTSDHNKLVQLRLKLKELPANPELMPTLLGNILRTAERKPLEKYGLDAIICWPRLWFLLPDSAKQELQSIRANLNSAARTWLWSNLFFIWVFLGAWWAVPLGLISAIFAYYWVLSTARTYGELIEAAFDIYRHLLYEALRCKIPHPTEEKQVGQKLTNYLLTGR